MNEFRPTRRLAPRGGFTLVEVLIALAIFVFGALAIIRIFPPALGVIQNSGDRLVASNMNRTLLNGAENQQFPDAVYDTVSDSSPSNWNNGVVGSVAGGRQNNPLPYPSSTNPTETFNGDLLTKVPLSALGHFKNISGERHTIPASGVVYTQFPINLANPFNAYQEFNVLGVTVDQAGNLDFTKATIQPSGLAYTPIVNDQILVSYRWLEDGRYWGVDGEKVDNTGTLPLQVKQAQTRSKPIVPGEVTVRLRSRINNALTAPPALPKSDVGQINFTYNSTTFPALVTGSEISFDYTVKDWSWLVFDSAPVTTPESATGSATTREVNLPVHFLDTDTKPSFFTCYPMEGTTATPNSVIRRSDLDYSSNPDTLQAINRTGQVPFETNSGDAQVSNARVAYRTADNWTQQLSVAAKHYNILFLGSTPSSEPWLQCALGKTRKYLYFHPSEAGKTVMVSYSHNTAGGSPATDMKVENQMLTISTNLLDYNITDNDAQIASTEGQIARLQFVGTDGFPIGDQVTSISKIDGMSVQSRTAWIDGSRFNQTIATRFRKGDSQ